MYIQGSTTPTYPILHNTAATFFPSSLAVDATGNLFVGSSNGNPTINTLAEFGPGASTAFVSSNDVQYGPLAIAPDGTIYTAGDILTALKGGAS
jgi:hypothetical protein